jgi:hypothetical protein
VNEGREDGGEQPIITSGVVGRWARSVSSVATHTSLPSFCPVFFAPLLNIFFSLDLHLPNLIGKKKLLMVQCNNPTRRLGNSTRTRSYGSPGE